MKGQDIMIYVGIDVASQKHDCFLLRDTGEVFSKTSFTIKNDFEGYKKLHNSILQFVESTKDSNVRIGLESTGHYSKNILLYLIKQGYQTTLINPILTNMDRKASTVRKTKTDKIDAEAICKFLDKNRFDFKPYTLLSYHIENENVSSSVTERHQINIRSGVHWQYIKTYRASGDSQSDLWLA